MNISLFHFTYGKNMIIPALIKHTNTSLFCITTNGRKIYLNIIINTLDKK